MHQASVLLRQILVLNDTVEFHTRRCLNTNETDLQAMQLLMQHGSMTPTELSERLHLSAAAVTTVIDRLVRREHAERVVHPGDRRRTLIRPIPAAAAEVLELIWPMIENSDAVVREMSAQEQAVVVRYLNGVAGSMRSFIEDLKGRLEAAESSIPLKD
ncbi:MarR family winged helix-turn-helix transcriptional regulator [Corynebacterium sp. A21]|uniref:MarR family winged helix-turn-helix transcriptional regulator n=1 Tax=Corynebacterium sp. A21 TaxID=3457318 RepID=UPI003FD4A434